MKYDSTLEIPLTEVAIDYPFAIASEEVTVDEMREFFKVTKGNPGLYQFRERYSPEGECPANRVSWFLAMEYCNWLSGAMVFPRNSGSIRRIFAGAAPVWPADYKSRLGYRLPTEVEWEYAARGGCSGPRPFGKDVLVLPDYATNRANSKLERMSVVGFRFPNQYGCFDMLGNALEWCLDPFNAKDTVTEGGMLAVQTTHVGPISYEDDFVARGGSFYNEDASIRVNYRYQYQPTSRPHGIRDFEFAAGFRKKFSDVLCCCDRPCR